MDSDLEYVPQAIAAYSEALQSLVDRLEAQLLWNRTVAEEFRRGGALPDILAAHDSATSALKMTQQLTEFERARFHMRASVARALRSLGLSNPEIADAFGVSRQLVHRILAGDREMSNS